MLNVHKSKIPHKTFPIKRLSNSGAHLFLAHQKKENHINPYCCENPDLPLRVLFRILNNRSYKAAFLFYKFLIF